MNYKHISTLKEHKAPIYSICEGESPSIFYSAGSDRYVIRWDLEKLEASKVVSKSPTTIISIAYLKELNYLLIGQVEGGVHVVDISSNKEVKYLKVHQGYIFDIQLIEKKKEIVFSSADGSISIWSVPDFELLFQNKITDGKIRKLAYSEEREELAIASSDNTVQILNILDWSKKAKVEGFEAAVNCLLYAKDNQLIVGGKNAHLHDVDLKSYKIIKSLPAHYWAIYDIAYSPNKRLFATASRDKTVKIWDVEEIRVLKRFEGQKDKAHTHSVNTLLWTSYQNYLLSAGDDYSIRVWQVE